MQESTAKVLAALLKQSGELNEILRDVQNAEPHEEFLKIRKMVADVMGSIYLEALRPIFEEHPALRPAGLS